MDDFGPAIPFDEPEWNFMINFTGNTFAALQNAINAVGTGKDDATVIWLNGNVTACEPDSELLVRGARHIKIACHDRRHAIDADMKSRVIFVEGEQACLYLENVTLKNGKAEVGAGVLNRGRLVLLDNAAIIRCMAKLHGGGVCNDGQASVTSVQGGSIAMNDSDQDGGGAWIPQGSRLLAVSGSINSNGAFGVGGGIFTPFENLESVTVNAGFVFGDNWAHSKHFLEDPAYVAMHDRLVRCTLFSASDTYGKEHFSNAYNNHDISFAPPQ